MLKKKYSMLKYFGKRSNRRKTFRKRRSLRKKNSKSKKNIRGG